MPGAIFLLCRKLLLWPVWEDIFLPNHKFIWFGRRVTIWLFWGIFIMHPSNFGKSLWKIFKILATTVNNSLYWTCCSFFFFSLDLLLFFLFFSLLWLTGAASSFQGLFSHSVVNWPFALQTLKTDWKAIRRELLKTAAWHLKKSRYPLAKGWWGKRGGKKKSHW